MKNSVFAKVLSIAHAILTILLGLFFMYKGYQKFEPVKLRDKHIKIENTESIVQKIIVEQNYEAPYGYDITMNTFRQSGFMKIIGLFQILAGLLILFPQTRMAGLLTLLPIILNIFLMHFYFDNRPHENIETGRLLLANVILLAFYWKPLLEILWRNNSKTRKY